MNTIKYLYSYWGSEHMRPKEFLALVISNGFDGIEINLPKDIEFERNFHEALNAVRQVNPSFSCGLQQVLGVKKETPEEYLDIVLKRLDRLVPYNPTFINSHTGKDHYSFSQNCKIIEAIEEFSIQHNIRVYHEIHRGRFTFHSLSTLKYLDVFPNLKFVGDLSHWCVVSESMLQDQADIIDKIIPRIRHIHARVGFEQSPQVNDPFVPEWKAHLDQFVKWWQSIVDHHLPYRDMTITPEFGPFPYMPTMPYTKEPLAKQSRLNMKLKEYLKTSLK
ncbi:sugar phosphate isomerase/epimerase family protein [Allomuricauda sp. SCSIO 65647]|uniref:sugar phosphate isomerase/epimerase family protein n=1 Tax=Allomuricauda sp. SCSIO 65647 TaxID=2908843 RepID=UPI001F3B6E1F|nr:sugar phosphate isomerase/epimerase [Muricauda sp. SCSIO 65647]UJH68898.1 sugar phosphate isomerase/epimerase [Muricauda sp. SCSIO 65647]